MFICKMFVIAFIVYNTSTVNKHTTTDNSPLYIFVKLFIVPKLLSKSTLILENICSSRNTTGLISFKDLCVLVFWTKVASTLDGLIKSEH